MAAPAAADPRQPSADGVGVYRPRRPRASPLYRLLERHFRELCLVWDERFASAFGDWRAVIPKVVDQFLACGLLEHGFARIRCDTCDHKYLLAFSCKARYLCPSCHAKRLTRRSPPLGLFRRGRPLAFLSHRIDPSGTLRDRTRW